MVAEMEEAPDFLDPKPPPPLDPKPPLPPLDLDWGFLDCFFAWSWEGVSVSAWRRPTPRGGG